MPRLSRTYTILRSHKTTVYYPKLTTHTPFCSSLRFVYPVSHAPFIEHPAFHGHSSLRCIKTHFTVHRQHSSYVPLPLLAMYMVLKKKRNRLHSTQATTLVDQPLRRKTHILQYTNNAVVRYHVLLLLLAMCVVVKKREEDCIPHKPQHL